MADPARYDVFAVLRLRKTQNNGEYPVAELEDERHEGGAWIKWADFKDYKAARRRNSTEDAVTSLGVEVAQLRAENERLRKAGDAMAHWIDYQHDKDGYPFSEAWDAAREGGYK